MFGIRLRLLIAFGGMLGIVLAMLLSANAVFDRFLLTVHRTVRDDLDSVIAARDMHDAVDSLDEAAEESTSTGNPPDARRVRAASADFDKALSLQFTRISLPGEAQQTQDIHNQWMNIRGAIDAMLNAGSATARTQCINEQLLPRIRQVRPLLTQLADANTRSIQGSHGTAHAQATSARWALRSIALVGLIAAIAFALVMGRQIVRPLSMMTSSAAAISRGDLEERLAIESRDEIGQLADAFNRMRAELKRLRALDADKLLRTCQTTQAAIDSLPDGIVMLDADGRVELANQTAARLFGIIAGQARLQDRAPWLRGALERPGASFDGYYTSVEVPDGDKRRRFLPQSVALRDPQNRVIGSTLILVDVTDFRRLDQMKDALLSMASHELKNPLQCMTLAIPQLLDEPRMIGPLNEDQVELLTATRDATERMQRIVEKILDLGRLTNGKIPMVIEPMRPIDLVEKTASALQPRFQQKGVALRVEVGEELAHVESDPIQMEHVLENLLNNALRHTPAGGRVTLSAASHDDVVRFRVTDTGCGIAAEHLPRIFEPFYRVPGQSKDTGTGLGLALVKQIIESHGGRIQVESRVGQGTTFFFTLRVIPNPADTPFDGQTDQALFSSRWASVPQETAP